MWTQTATKFWLSLYLNDDFHMWIRILECGNKSWPWIWGTMSSTCSHVNYIWLTLLHMRIRISTCANRSWHMKSWMCFFKCEFHIFTFSRVICLDLIFFYMETKIFTCGKKKNQNFKFVNWIFTRPKMWTVHIQNRFPFFTFEWQYPHVKAVIAHVDSNFHMWKQIMTHVNLLLHMWIPHFHTFSHVWEQLYEVLVSFHVNWDFLNRSLKQRCRQILNFEKNSDLV